MSVPAAGGGSPGDLPAGLVVDPADVARRLGITSPTQAQLATIADAILDAQDAVEGELGRPLFPELVVLAGQRPAFGAGDLGSWRAWSPGFDDDYTVVDRVAAGDGTWTVTYSVGLDARAERPIVGYVRAHAAALLRETPGNGVDVARVVTSLSAEGQSISYAASSAGGAGAAGAAPTLAGLRRYKRRAIFKQNLGVRPPWPYSGVRAGGGW